MKEHLHIYLLLATSYISYFLIGYIYNRMGLNNLMDALSSKRNLILVNAKHSTGIFFFGIVFLFCAPNYLYLIKRFGTYDAMILLALLAVVLLTMAISKISAEKQPLKQMPMEWYRTGDGLLYLTVRLLFLFCYEFFFRGVLFHSVLQATDLFTAIAINVVLYMAIHWFDSKKEILGCIPFGITLCLFSYSTQSIWPAFLIHASLSYVYESFLLKSINIKIVKP